MNWRVMTLFVFIFLIIMALGAYYFRTSIFPQGPFNTILEYKQAIGLIQSNCNETMFSDDQSKIDYFLGLYSSFGSDIRIDEGSGYFVSPSNKHFTLQFFNVEEETVIAKRQLILFPSPTEQKSYCWIAEIEDTPGIGRAAYETQSGEIKVIRVKNLPAFSP